MNWKKIKKGIKKPNYFLSGLLKRLSFLINDDRRYINIRWKLSMGYEMPWDNPQTYNEKLQWLKLFDRKPIYNILVDKYLVKDYVAKLIGEKYVIPLIGVWDNVDDIDFDKLPDKFVLKCNHNSGTGMYICKDKSKLDINNVRKGLIKGLKQNYYLRNREWPYKDVPRKIIAEQYMEDENTGELRDYKFFCFNGEVKCLFIASERSNGDDSVCFDYFDLDYNHLPIKRGHPNAKVKPEKPINFEKMKSIAAFLSRGIPCVRIDLYEVNGNIYFGEYTFSHGGGFIRFQPDKWDKVFGDWIKLPNSSSDNS